MLKCSLFSHFKMWNRIAVLSKSSFLKLLSKDILTKCQWQGSQELNDKMSVGVGKKCIRLLKQQISLVVSLWRSPLTFVWPGVPKQCVTTAPSSRSKHHLTVFCIDEIVPGYVVYHVNCGAHISNFNINEFSWTAGNQI